MTLCNGNDKSACLNFFCQCRNLLMVFSFLVFTENREKKSLLLKVMTQQKIVCFDSCIYCKRKLEWKSPTFLVPNQYNLLLTAYMESCWDLQAMNEYLLEHHFLFLTPTATTNICKKNGSTYLYASLDMKKQMVIVIWNHKQSLTLLICVLRTLIGEIYHCPECCGSETTSARFSTSFLTSIKIHRRQNWSWCVHHTSLL